MSLLDSDGPCYDPDLYASLGDDARKAARENAVTPAYEGYTDEELFTAMNHDPMNSGAAQDALILRGYASLRGDACTCTLACVGARWLTENYYCRKAAREDAVTEAYEGEAVNERCRCGKSLDKNGEHDGGYGGWCG